MKKVEPEEDEATLRNPSVSQYFVSAAKPNQVPVQTGMAEAVALVTDSRSLQLSLYPLIQKLAIHRKLSYRYILRGELAKYRREPVRAHSQATRQSRYPVWNKITVLRLRKQIRKQYFTSSYLVTFRSYGSSI